MSTPEITTEIATDMIEEALLSIALRRNEALNQRMGSDRPPVALAPDLPPTARRLAEVRDDFETVLGLIQDGLFVLVDVRTQPTEEPS